MGYSCSKNANDTLDKINNILQSEYANQLPTTEKGTVIDYTVPSGFFEIGKENYDGAITGTVWKFKGTYDNTGKFNCNKSGSFRIEPSGFITRFPLLPKEIKKIINEPLAFHNPKLINNDVLNNLSLNQLNQLDKMLSNI
tara:strand:+ start:275 stop:694 length:420 start_codon:yes stop_codon:yes gene_type:complete